MATDVIQVSHLKVSFLDNHVLKDFTIQLKQGENLIILGASGSGKSVLIKCIIGLMVADSGSIKVFGDEVTELTPEELNKMRAKVGFLFQSNALYDSMTIRENLRFPLIRHWVKNVRETAEELVMEALTNVGLEDTADKFPSELSGGMQKRIALARTLILKPQVILYDEPTAGLDPITGKEICQLMLELQKKYHTSSIIITHDLNCVKIMASRIVMLIDGICYATGTFEELKQLKDKRVTDFFD
ncbi:MAG: ATP-binding cassette domain-containing protein [Bacteroidetes bacterium]|nr:MAG: ATP-binding cassette domain-containing protein [Bacteroidota bacterium]